MTALGLKACLLGYKVLFKNATTLAAELRETRDNYQLRKMEKAIAGTDLLLLDELSYASFTQEESKLLFKVIAERTERTSTVIMTNLEFSRWTEMFSNDTLVAALVGPFNVPFQRPKYEWNILPSAKPDKELN